MYKIEVNNAKKILIIHTGGYFQEEEAKNFLNDYKNTVKSIVASDFTLALEGSELSTSKPDMVPVLENCMKMYRDTGFKNIISSEPNSSIAFMQIKRLLHSLNMNIEFVRSLSNL